jgi:glyoxylase-like metal-dependent hydrolase (beta-lactamase superfamily II)
MPPTRLYVAATLAFLLVAGPCALAQTPTTPDALSFPLGAFQVTVLHDSELVALNDGKKLVSDQAAAARLLAAAGGPPDKVFMSDDVLLVKTPGHLVMIDAGNGPVLKGVLMDSLAKAGVSPDQITDVLITHAHHDHVDGLGDADHRPVFPKAVIHMSAPEWAFMQAQPKTRDLAAAIASRVKTFAPGKPVLPGITPINLYGHTPGHVGYEITSQGRTLTDIGDTVHSHILGLARPDWEDGADADKAVGVAVRAAEVKRLADARALVFAPHFPFPGVGRILPAAEGYAWKAEVPVR